MEYKGFTGVTEFDEEALVYHGRVIGIRDVVTFEGDTEAEAAKEFQNSVDDYIELCTSRGEAPCTPLTTS